MCIYKSWGLKLFKGVEDIMEEVYSKTELEKIPNGWQVRKFSDVIEKIVGGGTPSRKIPQYFYGDIPWATVKDLDNSFYKYDTIEHISLDAVENSATNVINSNKIIIATRMGLGRGFINKVPMAINQDLKGIYLKDNMSTEFLMFWYLYNRSNIEMMGKGSTVKGIRQEELKEMPILVPPLKEQQKIAKILSTIDDLIEQTDALIEKTKELKRGLMQRLLTKGIGHTEFKKTEIGEIPVEWGVQQFGNVVEKIVGGGTPSRKKKEYFKGEIPWATVKDLDDKFYKYDTIEHITEEAINESSASIVESNNIIVATRMGLGRGFINKAPMAINQDLKGIYSNKNMSTEFIMFWILLNGNKFEMMGKGSTVKGIRLEELRKILIPVTLLQEQRKIASILLSVDTNIDKHVTEKQKLQTLKQGLMQKLLTGKIRVKVS